MSRSLRIPRPPPREIRQLQAAVAEAQSAPVRRRAEAILLVAAGMSGADIAAAFGVHAQTIYADLRAFAHHRLRCLDAFGRPGRRARLPLAARATIRQLAAREPGALGLPFGRWTLSTLRAYVLHHRIVRAISREHLRRVLKKGGTRSAASFASSGARTPTGGISSTGSGSCGSTGLAGVSCCFSM
jgi:transposase